MPISDYTEGNIRNKIINKVNPKIRKGRSKHSKGLIYLGEKLVSKVKIPNNHDRIMKPKKSQFIALALKLDDDEFNSLMDCPMTGPKYYQLLEEKKLEIV